MELRDELYELMKVLRVLKQQRHPVLPAGTVGLLQAIDRVRSATGGCHLKQVAAACALDQSTASRAVSAAERDGLVRRVADPHDGRASLLELTDAGRTTLADAITWYDSLLSGALRDWSAEDLERFGGYLRRFTNDLHASQLEATR
ncbi:winged helix-turn-helix transcriptional regulator [Dactylosporangium aurantiacum]|uniref:Winged helix-turn-helix transcriptional regulator n=1 Tax=Dactylosporangium aurantiacum TaxID=35754 RepID=A0A9Q9MLG6_9ACTN|nr:MarR family winged helix-turn-helix transcriptional regulator [Dactylosporangium aurantiacum]MDG6104094.1 MarR family winged helix-turn-helix transcriptional regulator [Dactylosporangium aurantiacum]UWZ56891.1 winged helix-turn-helix transcriptional regulator [Dactylosporangium aurantiacum]